MVCSVQNNVVLIVKKNTVCCCRQIEILVIAFLSVLALAIEINGVEEIYLIDSKDCWMEPVADISHKMTVGLISVV